MLKKSKKEYKGENILDYNFCYICGKKVDNDMCFCPYCGEKFKAIDKKEDEKYTINENHDDIVNVKLKQEEVSMKKYLEETTNEKCGKENCFFEEEKNIPQIISNEIGVIDKNNKSNNIENNRYVQGLDIHGETNIDNQEIQSISKNNIDLDDLSSKFMDKSKKEITIGRRVMNIIGSVILWIFSILFMLLFLITIFSRVFVSAIICLIVSLFINPLIFDKLINRKIKISRWICVIVIVFGFLLATVFLNLSSQL